MKKKTEKPENIDSRLNLEAVVRGLIKDAEDLRSGKITVTQARASAELGRQIINGVKTIFIGRKHLEQISQDVTVFKGGKIEN